MASYLKSIKEKEINPGSYLQRNLGNKDISQLTPDKFIELLIKTKQPQIFAESEIIGNGTDWNQLKLSILGDISFAVPVTVYDDGRHSYPQIHITPFNATLLFTPGALLRNGTNYLPADWDEVTTNDKIVFEKYYSLYERRLLPPFLHANATANANNTTAFITIPGLGCGQFAGKFIGQLGEI